MSKLIQLLNILLRVYFEAKEYLDRIEKEKDKKKHDAEIEKINEDPVAWFNERYNQAHPKDKPNEKTDSDDNP